MELPRDAEAVAGDEDAIEDDRRAGRIEGDALGLERGRPDRAPELARLAPSETHRGDRLVRAPDDDPERALERLVERRAGEVRPDDLVADERGKERALQAHRMVVHQPQPRDHEHPRAGPEAERVGDGAVRSREPHGKEPRRDVLALGREVPGEAAELEDVVIDRRRRHERPEAVAPGDQVLALEQLQRLPEGHERDAEARREPALGFEPRPGTERALADPRTQRLGDLVVPRQATVDPSVSIHPKSSRCSRTPSSRACRESADTRRQRKATPTGTWALPRRPILGPGGRRSQAPELSSHGQAPERGRPAARASGAPRPRRPTGPLPQIGRATSDSSHGYISYAVFCLKKKKEDKRTYAKQQTQPA